ncbi:MAG: ribonuclease HII [Succinivibrio sp.]
MRKGAARSFEYPVDPKAHLVCGADEAGRGPLMGNVVAGCVILRPDDRIEGLDDSKRLSAKKREALELEIKSRALAWGVGQCTPEEIDSINILNASMLAMKRAYEAMGRACELMLVDGNKVPAGLEVSAMAVVGGDALVPEISAASILAKVERDRQMMELDRLHPEYGFARHKGYPTAAHLEALSRLPVLPCYRRSYAPVQRILKARGLL